MANQRKVNLIKEAIPIVEELIASMEKGSEIERLSTNCLSIAKRYVYSCGSDSFIEEAKLAALNCYGHLEHWRDRELYCRKTAAAHLVSMMHKENYERYFNTIVEINKIFIGDECLK